MVAQPIQRCGKVHRGMFGLPTDACTPRKIVLTYVLERPNPIKLISVDGVGPRLWQGSQKYCLAVIDHVSRFMVTRASDVLIIS